MEDATFSSPKMFPIGKPIILANYLFVQLPKTLESTLVCLLFTLEFLSTLIMKSLKKRRDAYLVGQPLISLWLVGSLLLNQFFKLFTYMPCKRRIFLRQLGPKLTKHARILSGVVLQLHRRWVWLSGRRFANQKFVVG